MKLSRRHFLGQLSGGALAASAPCLWLPRYAHATPAHGAVDHLLVLFAKGGLRSHCLFNAVGTEQHNPFGAQASTDGSDWVLGAACGSQAHSSSLGPVPSLAEVAPDVAVLACVDHTPGERIVDTDHRTAVNRLAGGDPERKSGLLSLLGTDLPRYAEGFSPDAMPPVEIRATEFGLGYGDYSTNRPLSLQGARRSLRSELSIGRGWKMAARQALDGRFKASRPLAYDARVGNFLLAKDRVSLFADMLQDPALDVLGSPTATQHGVTNGQLIEVLGDYSLRDLGDPDDILSWGSDVALALRFFSFGSPMVVVTRDIYDLHDDERDKFEPRSQDLARQLAGLNFLLKTLDHPSGGKYWQRTLVVVVSEFSRNNTEANGFNSGNGSDHVDIEPDPCRNQAIAVMGGAVQVPGKLIGSTDQEMRAQGKIFSSRSLLATFVDVLGGNSRRYWPDAPISELFT